MIIIKDIICCDGDYHWLYVENNLVYENHNLDPLHLCQSINDYIESKDRLIDKIEFESIYVNEDYAENGLPQLFSDIPLEMLEE